MGGTSGSAGSSGSTGTGGKAGVSGGGIAGAVGTAGTNGTGGKGGASGTNGGGTSGAGGAGGAPGGTQGTGGASASTGALIQNDVFWTDTSGNPIYSQSGTVIKVASTYYWYGNKYQGAVTYAANPTGKNSDTTFDGVTCYSSTDLVHWKFENTVLVRASVPGSAASDWFGRMGVVYNTTTQKYVLIMEYIPSTATLGRELFATSSTPTGVFAFDHIQTTLTNVANGAPGDQTVFTDDDGQAYLILSSADGRSNLYVAPLRPSDFLNVESATRIFGGPGREGNCMFKYNGVYYFASSDLHGWNASHTYVISAKNILGPYSAESIMANTDADFSHVTQTGFFITVKGASQTTVIFAGDRWSDFAGNGIGYNQWVPLTFVGTAPQFQSLSQWSLDAVTGTWSVGPGNNYALNPSFEADRVTMTEPAGWTTSTTLGGGATPYTNLGGGHSGKWKWRLTDTVSYQASIAQTVTGLPNGTYTLSTWIQSSGGQSVAQLFARNFGGAEEDAAVNSAIGTWKQISITGIVVTNGTCQIGVETTAGANQWVDLDDVTLVKTSN
jgi:Glycosyl hydrolases family 43